MNDEKLRAVTVSEWADGGEHYSVGKNGVTAIEWGWSNGHMAALPTVKVFKNGIIHSEHPFSSVLGVYYATPDLTGEKP